MYIKKFRCPHPCSWKKNANHRFSSAPTLMVAIELLPHHTITRVDDPDDPRGYRLAFTGYMDNTVKYFARAMNFKYVELAH